MTSRSSIESHYAYGGNNIADRIQAALMDEPLTVDTLAPVDHFHGRGLAATRELVELLQPGPEDRILDLGSGIGGPARWLAAHHGCHVTGVDLTAEFCAAARTLTQATELTDRVEIVHGNAVQTPFPDGSFDKAYSQNVVMNVADKLAFYREAYRVLKPGGLLILTNSAAGPNGAPYYPSPWASRAEDSFLATMDETRRDLEAAGFKIEKLESFSGSATEAEKSLAALQANGLPKIGFHLLFGEQFLENMLNGARSRCEGRVIEIHAVVRKPN